MYAQYEVMGINFRRSRCSTTFDEVQWTSLCHVLALLYISVYNMGIVLASAIACWYYRARLASCIEQTGSKILPAWNSLFQTQSRCRQCMLPCQGRRSEMLS